MPRTATKQPAKAATRTRKAASKPAKATNATKAKNAKQAASPAAKPADAAKAKPQPNAKVGVIGAIVDSLHKATANKPITKHEILTKLVAQFPDREPTAMMRTINCQLPSRLRADKGLNIQRDGKAFWIE